MEIPLHNRLKKQMHREMAALQDLVVEKMYSADESAVLHGGTAIWRCFKGSRFSEDLDFYLKPKESFRESIESALNAAGAKLSKFRQTGNAIYAKVEYGRSSMSLEIALRKFPNPVASGYEKTDGTFIDALTPSTPALLLEKLDAYLSRRLIRDIYDVYFLSRQVKEDEAYNKKVSGMLEKLPKPADEQNLKNLILSGAVPSFSQMAEALKWRFSG